MKKTLIKKSSITSRSLKLISFKKFLELVQVKSYSKGRKEVLFNTLIKQDLDTAEYIRSRAVLLNAAGDRHYLATVFTSFPLKKIYKQPMLRMFEDLITDSIENWGNPEYLVRLSKRTWMTASVDDFRILESDQGTALAVFRRAGIQIAEMLDFTEEEGESALKEWEDGV